jgi:hypothetical protein
MELTELKHLLLKAQQFFQEQVIQIKTIKAR